MKDEISALSDSLDALDDFMCGRDGVLDTMTNCTKGFVIKVGSDYLIKECILFSNLIDLAWVFDSVEDAEKVMCKLDGDAGKFARVIEMRYTDR